MERSEAAGEPTLGRRDLLQGVAGAGVASTAGVGTVSGAPVTRTGRGPVPVPHIDLPPGTVPQVSSGGLAVSPPTPSANQKPVYFTGISLNGTPVLENSLVSAYDKEAGEFYTFAGGGVTEQLTGNVPGYRVGGRYTSALHTLAVTSTVRLFPQQQSVLVTVQFRNAGDQTLSVDFSDEFITQDIGMGKLTLANPGSNYRFAIGGQRQSTFANASQFSTYQPSGTPSATVYDDQRGASLHLFDGATPVSMAVAFVENPRIGLLVENVTLAPGETAQWTLGFAIHRGGEGAPQRGGNLLSNVSVPDAPPAPEATPTPSEEGPTVRTTSTVTKDKARTDATVIPTAANQTATIDLPDQTNRSFDVSSMSVSPAVEEEFSLSVQSSVDPLPSSPRFAISDSHRALGYISIDHDIPNEQISRVSFTFRLNKSRVQAANSSPEEIALYRYDGQKWVAQPTTLVRETESKYVFRTNATALSEWTAGSQRPEFEIANATASVTKVRTNRAVDINVRINNLGQATGVYVVKLLLDEEVVERRRATVPGGSSIRTTFTRSFDQPGEYRVLVNDVFVDTVTVSGEGGGGGSPGGMTEIAVAGGGLATLLGVLGYWLLK